MCSGIWVISRGIYFGRARFVFHLGLAVLAFGLFLFVSDFLGCACVLFAFILQMFSALVCGRISVPCLFHVDATLSCPCKTQRILSSINWVQHRVSRIGQFFWEVFVFRIFGLRL